jgi:hypothetical protein
LERARTLLDAAPRQVDGLPTGWDAIWLDAYSANVSRLLGRPREAVGILEGAVRAVSPDHGYDQSVYWSGLGIAHASMGEVEGACDAFSHSVSAAVEHRLPARVRQAIAARTRLTPWEDSPYVRQLDQQLEAARW